jgi:hypothetical protein
MPRRTLGLAWPLGIALAHDTLVAGEIDEGRYGDRRIVRLEISDGPESGDQR